MHIILEHPVSYLRPLVYQSGCKLEGRWYRQSYLFYRPEGSMEPSSLDTLFHPVGTSLIETDGSSATHSCPDAATLIQIGPLLRPTVDVGANFRRRVSSANGEANP